MFAWFLDEKRFYKFHLVKNYRYIITSFNLISFVLFTDDFWFFFRLMYFLHFYSMLLWHTNWGTFIRLIHTFFAHCCNFVIPLYGPQQLKHLSFDVYYYCLSLIFINKYANTLATSVVTQFTNGDFGFDVISLLYPFLHKEDQKIKNSWTNRLISSYCESFDQRIARGCNCWKLWPFVNRV